MQQFNQAGQCWQTRDAVHPPYKLNTPLPLTFEYVSSVPHLKWIIHIMLIILSKSSNQ